MPASICEFAAKLCAAGVSRAGSHIISNVYFLLYGHSAPGDRSYFTDYARDLHENERHEHVFCGQQNLPGVRCPNEDKPLIQLLSLDTSDSRLEVTGCPARQLPLLYCWTCAVCEHDSSKGEFFTSEAMSQWRRTPNRPRAWCAGGEYPPGSGIFRWTYAAPFFYRIHETGVITFLQYSKGRIPAGEPYPDYPTWFPASRAWLFEANNRVQDSIREMNNFSLEDERALEELPEIGSPHHQVGGEPYLVQGSDYILRCPVCGAPMPVLAAIADDCLDPRGFVGDPGVQVVFHCCRRCWVIGAFNLFD